MTNDTEAVQIINAQDSALDPASAAAAAAEEFQLLHDVVRSLPSHAVKDLLSNGVCPRCIFRLFGVQGHIYSHSSLSQSTLCSFLGELTDPERNTVENSLSRKEESSNPYSSHESEVALEICRICLGILQFVYCDDKEMLVKKDAATDFAASTAELVKQEDHQIDSFSLEVSIPPTITENENAV